MMESPFEIFEEWYSNQLKYDKATIPSACCFSTIGTDGFPNSRFVSLKEIKDEAFVITGPLNSRKGRDLQNTPKCSIVFWWNETNRQIRIQGVAEQIPEKEAVNYFEQRNRASKIVSTVFDQGREIHNLVELENRFAEGNLEYEHRTIKKPKQWSGFYIRPLRIEFMHFMNSRLHQRTLYSKLDDDWEKVYLQP